MKAIIPKFLQTVENREKPNSREPVPSRDSNWVPPEESFVHRKQARPH